MARGLKGEGWLEARQFSHARDTLHDLGVAQSLETRGVTSVLLEFGFLMPATGDAALPFVGVNAGAVRDLAQAQADAHRSQACAGRVEIGVGLPLRARIRQREARDLEDSAQGWQWASQFQFALESHSSPYSRLQFRGSAGQNARLPMLTPLPYTAALEWLFGRTRAGDERSHERSRALLEVLGHPEYDFPSVHVLGTNGKGSVSAMLAAGFHASGSRVGLFTSPHLLDFRERVAVNSELIPPETVLEFVGWARVHASGAAFFDLSFLMAMQHFAKSHVDWGVIEAGVGGANDASNALTRVALTVLTNVDYDHEAVIGVGPEDSILKNIALEKAGAIRAGVPVVTAARGEGLAVIRRVARERGAHLYELNLEQPLFSLPKAPTLRGVHQLENARLAVAALRLLGHTEAAISAALEATWPGRLEVFRNRQQRVWLDGAHNPAGALALASSLTGHFALLFGAMERKNVPALLGPLLCLCDSLHFVSPGALGADPHQLAARFGGTAYDSLETALSATLEASERVLIAGSLYLVGAARAKLIEAGFSAE